MIVGTLADTIGELTDIQRKAVEWDEGPLLVLAGPGSGKTRVLTCRVARLLDASPNERFRILALTFTNKAAHEMKSRIAALVPGSEERAEINTFHGFCARLLRQHGVHLGMKPNFEIYSRTADREALLKDALQRGSDGFEHDDTRFLPRIDALKARLISPEQADRYLMRHDTSREASERIALAYRLYEEELKRSNALDFNSLIILAHQILNYPKLAEHFRTIYRYWLIDEFQDTNGPQYDLLRRMAGDSFHQLFAVADDDQTIYEWNGANVRRIGSLVKDFECEVVQLTDNFRCPPGIVEAANRLVVYNVRRDLSKRSAEAAKSRPETETNESEIRCLVFPSDAGEARGIATEVAALDAEERGQTAILARNRALLETVQDELASLNVPTALLARRDDFASPQMRWLVAGLKQINRPLDRRNMVTLIETFRSFTGAALDFEDLEVRSEAGQVALMTVWFDSVRKASPPKPASKAVDTLARFASGDKRLPDTVKTVIECFESKGADGDFNDDVSAWRRIEREIRQAHGAVSLDQFLQEMALRSKQPVPEPGSVSLGTIHGAKGLEFDRVYLMGLAEEVLPSWHSVKNDNSSAALEEERRGCFVAITRAKRCLILSRAKTYRGWKKRPSRFLEEMGLLSDGPGRSLA
ncbi:MAG: ATP-dependent helicase [Gammaproteobacteria bacterium]|nr:ATP-dependent helicase [Gammaproteobacteria bacterium]